MSDPMNPRVRHPDELLAGYVDGSATPEDRAVVDQHLATCATCREEVQLAADARAALISLPELGAPGLAEAGVLALRRAAFQAVPSDGADGAPDTAPEPATPHRTAAAVPTEPRARLRAAWVQLVAAAAIVAVLGGLIAIPFLLSGNNASKSTSINAAAGPAASSSALPPLIDQGANYSQSSLDSLAARITTEVRDERLAARGSAQATSAPAAHLPQAPAIQDASAARAALTCLIQGGGPEDVAPVYLEQAEVSGTSAFVGGFFLRGARLNVMVIAVSRDGCQPLYSIRRQA
jgi:anti-sigma factor RsiW